MNTRTQAVLDNLRNGFSELRNVELTPDEINFIMLQRQSDGITIAGLDPEFELVFGESLQSLRRALLIKAVPAAKQQALEEAKPRTGRRAPRRVTAATKA